MRPLLTLLFLVVWAPDALALGPGEQGFSLEAAGEVALRPGRRFGPGWGLSYARGLTDDLAIRASVGGAYLPSASARGILSTHVALGPTFALDVLSTIPYLDVALLGVDFRDIVNSSQWLGTRVELGVDHLLSRHAGVGLGLRSDLCLLRLAGPRPSAWPLLLSLAFRYVRYF
jgi:hypothetical protein